MSKNVAKRAAAEIARQIIDAARNSGPDPVVWITGNAMMPPLRWLSAAEHIWQLPGNSPDAWDALIYRLESLLDKAEVALECPEHDNALYAVDLARFEYVEDPDGETLQADWRPVAA
jgi:hypothetical protein